MDEHAGDMPAVSGSAHGEGWTVGVDMEIDVKTSRRFLVVMLAVIAALFMTACGSKSIPVADSSATLAVSLKAAGLDVTGPKDNDPLNANIFSIAGVYYGVDNEQVLAYEFDTAQDAQTAASSISPDGYGVGSKYVGWGGDPHFYESGKLIAVYVGSSSKLMDALTAAMGAQVAGATGAG